VTTIVGNWVVNSNEHRDGMEETGGRTDWSVISGKLAKPYIDSEYKVSFFKYLSNLTRENRVDNPKWNDAQIKKISCGGKPSSESMSSNVGFR
jgi:chorismate synthase